MKLSERIVFVMSMKYAQRRSVEDVADEIKVDPKTCRCVMIALREGGLVRCWPGDEWGLTSAGNVTRNRLTSLPRSRCGYS